MKFLSDKHILTIKWLLRSQPDKILFIMDGFDEFNPETSPDITSIMDGNLFNDVCCVVTARPEAASKVKKWERVSFREAELKGFSDEHIEEYIKKYFTKSKTKGEELCKLIFPGRFHYSYLLELARNPGTLSMICTLHEQGRPIGTSREQLYEEFVAFVLSRWEQRHQKPTYKTPRKHILDKYNTVLLKFGHLAYTVDGNQKMELSFTMYKVMTIVGEDAMQYGLLYKSHPVSHYSDCEVSFLHKTVQEYLAGYYIIHKEMDSFKEKCKNMTFLRAEKSMMRFIIHQHLTPDEAVQFVKYLIKSNPTEDLLFESNPTEGLLFESNPTEGLLFKSNPTEDLLKYLLQDLMRGYQHEIEPEPVIITHKEYRYEYMFPSCGIKYKQNKAHQEYSKYIKINKQCVKINLPQIQDVQSLEVRGDGGFDIIDSDVLVTCCRDCEVNLKVEAHNLQDLELRYINKVGVLEVHGAHHRLEVEMYEVNLNGCLSRTGPWMTNLQSLIMWNRCLCDSDLSDLAACFRSCSQRSASTGMYCIYTVITSTFDSMLPKC